MVIATGVVVACFSDPPRKDKHGSGGGEGGGDGGDGYSPLAADDGAEAGPGSGAQRISRRSQSEAEAVKIQRFIGDNAVGDGHNGSLSLNNGSPSAAAAAPSLYDILTEPQVRWHGT